MRSVGKHRFPVERNCSWAHGGGIAVKPRNACVFPGGSRPRNYREIWDCVEENQCYLTAGDVQQMAIFRDPRSVAVSTYFWKSLYNNVTDSGQPLETVDQYALRVLPILCQWIAVRHVLFGVYLAEQSTIFWYEDIKAKPIEYHRKWLASVGVHLPARELEIATETALGGEFGFWTKGFDPHPGSSIHPENRTFRDELMDDTLAQMDVILRQWLPPVFLSKLGVSRAKKSAVSQAKKSRLSQESKAAIARAKKSAAVSRDQKSGVSPIKKFRVSRTKKSGAFASKDVPR